MPLRFAPVRRISFMDTSAQTEDAFVKRYDLVEVLSFHGLEHDPTVTLEQDRRVRLDVFAHGNALHTAKSFLDRKSTRLNSSHLVISYAVYCLKKKTS